MKIPGVSGGAYALEDYNTGPVLDAIERKLRKQDKKKKKTKMKMTKSKEDKYDI